MWHELGRSLARRVEPRGILELAVTLLLVAGTADRREVRRCVDIELRVPPAARIAREDVVDLQVSERLRLAAPVAVAAPRLRESQEQQPVLVGDYGYLAFLAKSQRGQRQMVHGLLPDRRRRRGSQHRWTIAAAGPNGDWTLPWEQWRKGSALS
jgi:hypothetical protein